MTDDQTRRVDLTAGPEPAPTGSGETSTVPADGSIDTTFAGGRAGFEAPAAAVSAPRPNRLRWIAGLGVAGAAVALAAGAFILFASEPTPEALRYIPADAAVVVEVRPELPGDQMQNVGNLLAHFPGFKDQSTLPEKIDEALSRAVSASEGEGVEYVADIKPWLNGPLFVGLRDIGSMDGDGGGAPSSYLVSATTTGTVGCDQVMAGKPVERETYRNLEIQSTSTTGGELPTGGGTLACVADGRQVLIGDPASVRAGLDAKADGTGIDKDARYTAARGSLSGDQLATAFVNGSAVAELVPIPSGDLPIPSGVPIPGLDGLGGLGGLAGGAIPDWVMSGVRAETDGLVIDTVTAPVPEPTAGPSLLALPPAHSSALVGMLPADTILFVEQQGAGVTLQNLLTTVGDLGGAGEIPEVGEALGMLEGLGGAGELVGWINDAGVAVVGDAGAPSGGLLLVATDEVAATRTVSSINGLVAMLGLQGSGIEVAKASVAGVEVTTVTLSDLGALVPPGSLPEGVEPSATGSIELSFAAKGRVVLVAVGDGFMTKVLNVQPGSSLADTAEFKAAAKHSLSSSRTAAYVGVPAALDLVEGFLSADELAEWQDEYAPYLAPLDAVALTATTDPAGNRSRVVITVGQPQ